SSTVTAKPRSSAPSAASSPMGPAPTTTSVFTAASTLAGHRVAGLDPMRDHAAAADHGGDADRLRHLLRRDPGLGACRRVRIDAIGLLDRVGHGEGDELLGLLVESALLHGGRIPLHEQIE